MIPIIVLASGRGSNFEAIDAAVQEGRLAAEIRGVLSDQPEAKVLEKARKRGIPALCVPFPPKGPPGCELTLPERRRLHEEKLLEALAPLAPRFLVMAGYMRIVTPTLLQAFGTGKGYSRIVNVHPSLLPAFPGLHGYAQAFRYGAKVAGATVHLLGEEEAAVDSGPVCAQESFSIADCRCVEEVEARGMAVEHRLYPAALNWILKEEFSLEERLHPSSIRRLCVCPH